MEFPLSLTDSTRAEDARPVEFPLSLRVSTRAEDTRPVEFPLSLRESTRAKDARPVEFPLSLRDSTRAEDARPVEFPLSLTRKRQEVCLATADSNILSKTGSFYLRILAVGTKLMGTGRRHTEKKCCDGIRAFAPFRTSRLRLCAACNSRTGSLI